MALKTIANSLELLILGSATYLSQTFGSPTDSNVWTASLWFKRSQFGARNGDDSTLFWAGVDSSNFTEITFEGNGATNTDDTIRFLHLSGGGTVDDVRTAASLRDPTAWYHLVVRYDSDEATASDRIRFWINGVQLTDFTVTNFPSSGTDTDFNTAQDHEIGRNRNLVDHYDGYLADVYWCDGQALSPTDFAEQQGDSWQPIAASPTFGNNGYLLEFDTAADLGDDTSGNGNDWTENGIFGNEQRKDTPTSNFLTFHTEYRGTPSSGSLTVSHGARRWNHASTDRVTIPATAALPKTGKYYWEVSWQAGFGGLGNLAVGVMDQLGGIEDRVGEDNHGWALYNPAGTTLAVRHDGADTNFTDTGTISPGDYVMVAVDMGTGDVWFGLNGTWLDSGDPGAGTNPAVTLTAADIFGGLLIPATSTEGITQTLYWRAAVDSGFDAPWDFEGTVPDGFSTLDTSTWPAPAVVRPSEHFDVVPYDGDNSSPRVFGGLDFQPDLVWLKGVTLVQDHLLTDIVKGAGSVHYNNVTSVDIAANADGYISGFQTDGFTVTAGGTSDDAVNDGAESYIAVCWLRSVLSGLDIVGYTGTAGAQSIAHNLGDVPDFMYVRNRDVDLVDHNVVYHGKRLDGVSVPIPDPEADYLEADTSAAAMTAASRWDDTAPTNTVFTVGTDVSTNDDGSEHAAYIWREIEGLSKFTSYVGTGGGSGVLDNPFVYTGFRAKLVFIKGTSVARDWRMVFRDNAVSGNPGGTDGSNFLESDEPDAQVTPASLVSLDICASGFKIRIGGDSEFNGNTEEYMVMAFAEVPFQFASMSPDILGDGAPEIEIELAGLGTNPNRHGDGAIDLMFQLDGEGSGGVALGAGAIDLKLEIDGQGTIVSTPNAAGAIDLKLEIDGQAFNTAIRGPAVTLPQLSTSGSEIVQSVPSPGLATIPPLIVGGVADISNPVETSALFRIPVLQTSGEINPVNNAVLPTLTTSGSIIAGTVSQGVVTLPVLQVVGSGISPLAAAGIVILPQLDVTGSIIAQGAVVTTPTTLAGLTTLPGLEANGQLLIPQEMAGSVILPALDLDPLTIIAPGAIVTGSVTLPILRLESILVNGVTLTATVWSMNTETLESTNYLNFDFVSLVSFADQPYGVTSTGIFLLEGDDDDGTNIDSRILTGISDRGIESLKEADSMYMQYDGGSMVFQLFPDGQQRVREYRFERRSNSVGVIHARAKGSRGLRSRSWQMGLRNLGGQDFTLDKLGLLLRILTRKTRKN